jgi:phage/plasmid-like protein (TIGR03299 family)
MSHEITIRQDGTAEAAFSLVGAWHGLGETTEQPVSVRDLYEKAKLGWKVETAPIGFPDSGILIAGAVGIRRTDTGASLGVASPKYPVFQNEELLNIAESVFGTEPVAETAFSLRGGQETVLTVNLGSDAIKAGKVEDAHRAYLLLGVGHTGERPIYALGTDTRVVCANTLRIAVGSTGKTLSREGVTIRHSSQQGERVAALVAALKDIKAGHTANLTALRKLVRTKMNKEARLDFFGKVIDFVLPMNPAVDGKAVLASIMGGETTDKVKETLRDRRRADLLGTILGFHGWETESNGMPGDSAYTAFQAVSDAVEHSVVSSRGTETQRAENRFMSRMNGKGDAVKQFAFALAGGATDPTVSTVAA